MSLESAGLCAGLLGVCFRICGEGCILAFLGGDLQIGMDGSTLA
jgi:hypothetical protein